MTFRRPADTINAYVLTNRLFNLIQEGIEVGLMPIGAGVIRLLRFEMRAEQISHRRIILFRVNAHVFHETIQGDQNRMLADLVSSLNFDLKKIFERFVFMFQHKSESVEGLLARAGIVLVKCCHRLLQIVFPPFLVQVIVLVIPGKPKHICDSKRSEGAVELLQNPDRSKRLTFLFSG
ncbi:MAG TPA: hypothetical protein EYG03_10345 [Planctomycetes bacterium]|nr:hypothetical protein [Fuerstiella sp.]HIK92366.1 hypothetical protein [Planctomycetota bacterium]